MHKGRDLRHLFLGEAEFVLVRIGGLEKLSHEFAALISHEHIGTDNVGTTVLPATSEIGRAHV